MRCRARSSAACLLWPVRNGGRKSVTASSSITTRTPKIAPPARLIRYALCRMRGSRRRSTGAKFPIAIPLTSLSSRSPARFADIGNPHAAMDESPGSLEKLLELADEDERSGSERRTVASALPQDGRRRCARGAIARQNRRCEKNRGEEASSSKDAADRGREFNR